MTVSDEHEGSERMGNWFWNTHPLEGYQMIKKNLMEQITQIAGAALRWLILGLALHSSVAHTQQPSFPLAEIAGKWTNDLQMTGQSQFTASENFFWVGKVWGALEPTGKFVFRSENGCQFEGLAAPFITGWNGQVAVSKCQNASMNRVYSISFNKAGQFLSMTGSASVMGVGRIEGTYAMKATLSRY